MTRQEAAQLRRQFITDAQNSLMRVTGAAERQLLNAIYKVLLDELGKEQGTIVNEAGNSIKLSTAIDRVFRHFNDSKNLEIIRGIVNDMQTIGDLNKKYFSIFRVRTQRLSAIVLDVETMMRKRIGLDADGNIIKRGWLDKLITDATLKTEVQQQMRKSMTNDWSVKQLLNGVKKIVVGDESRMGGLSHHYRTFVHDAFSKYDDGFANGVSIKLGLNAAIYEGGLIGTSRKFCRKHDGQVLTRAEIENLKNDPTLLKTKEERNGAPLDYDPFTDKGRWNCRHQWNWITDDEAMRLRPNIKL